MEIKELLTKPESKTLEFKKDLSSLLPILKTIVAFANTAGGTLVIGVSSEGKLVGLHDVFQDEESLASSIADNIRPMILPEIEVTTFEGKHLLIVRVPYWKAPFYLKKEGKPKGVYVRLGSTNRPADQELLAELQRSILSPSFDQEPLIDLSKEDLQIDLATKLFAEVKKKISLEKLLSLGVLVSHAKHTVPSIGGLILFGKKERREQFIPHAKVNCARFLGDGKTHILDRLEIEGTILEAIEQVLKFIARNSRLSSEIPGIRRKDIPQYPPVAVREALINALVHSDYSISGSGIQVAIFDDRLEIQNPGMFPFGFTLEDFKAGISRTRNRVVVRVFHELQLMEEWGSGYKRIVDTCTEGGYPLPTWEELGTTIKVIFYSYKGAFSEKQEGVNQEELSVREELILSLFREGEVLAFREVFERIFPKISERMLRYNLAQLRRKGRLSSRGKGRAITWQRTG